MKKPDMPDLSGIKEKLKIDKLLNTIADVVDSNKPFSNEDPDDAIGQKVEELDTLVCELLEAHKQHVDQLSQVHSLLSELVGDVNRLRDQHRTESSSTEDVKAADDVKAAPAEESESTETAAEQASADQDEGADKDAESK